MKATYKVYLRTEEHWRRMRFIIKSLTAQGVDYSVTFDSDVTGEFALIETT